MGLCMPKRKTAFRLRFQGFLVCRSRELSRLITASSFWLSRYILLVQEYQKHDVGCNGEGV